MTGPRPATSELHCVCGEPRTVPAGLPLALSLSSAALASFACVACLVAAPQARRSAGWQRHQLELALRARRA